MIEWAYEDDVKFYGNGIWNTLFDLWERNTTYVRDRERVVHKLVSADDKAIKKCLEFIGPRWGVFQLLVPREDHTEREK